MDTNLYVVFLPPALEAADTSGSTKKQRIAQSSDALSSMLEDAGIGVIEGLSESNAPTMLPAVGAVVMDLDDGQASDLVSMGATVVPDFPIPMIQPVEEIAALGHPWHLEHVNVTAFWNAGYRGTGTVVGILDTGIDPNHPEFAGKTVAFQEFDSRGRPVYGTAHDYGSHGTHVSGIAAGRTCGVAPEADLAVACVLGPGTGTFARITAGINWLASTSVADRDVDVINASLGLSGYHSSLYVPISNASRIDGILTIAAIGNAGLRGINNHGSPGNYDVVLGVGATDPVDVAAGFSDWGVVAAHAGLLKPDMAAPGVNIYSSVPGGYGLMSGTSMASPCVAGAAVLMMQRNPALRGNPSALRSALLASVVPAAPKPKTGSGRLRL